MKITKIASGLLVSLLALCCFTACDDDNDSNPVIGPTPSSFVLNTPALAETPIEITESSVLSFSWSAPNYGFPARTTYKIQVGEVQNDGNIKWQTDKLGNNVFLGAPDSYTGLTANVPASQVAEALCSIDGVTRTEDYVDMGSRPIAFRVYADLLEDNPSQTETSNTGVFSNAVIYKSVQSYCAVVNPRTFYIVGQPSGWKEPSPANAPSYADWQLHETGARTGIFIGTYTFEAGDQGMRFYTTLDGWGDNGATTCWGANANDGDNKELTASDGTYSSDVTNGKGNFVLKNFPGGKCKITLDINNKKITFEEVDE